MSKIGFVFAGQGSQFSGMGKDLYQKYDSFKKVFDDCSTIRADIKELCFDSDLATISQTKNTQPCIYAMSVGIAKILEDNNISASSCAGFSLGELSALQYAKVYDIKAGFDIVSNRANIMEIATKTSTAYMYAVVKVSTEVVIDICKKIKNAYPVNFNSPLQTVVACDANESESFLKAVSDAGARALKLNVSGGFHSPFMNNASNEFLNILNSTFILNSPKLELYSNLTGELYDNNNMKVLLSKQINNPVKWIDVINNMIKSGIDTFIEIGPGKTLSGLINKINSEVKVMNVQNCEDIDKIIDFYKENCDVN